MSNAQFNTPFSKKTIVLKKPQLQRDDLDWLALHDFDLQEILYEIFMTYTPDGEEFFYYRVFERKVAEAGLNPCTPDYLDVMLRAQNIAVQIYNQVTHSPYFEFIIRATIEEFTMQGDDITILLDFES